MAAREKIPTDRQKRLEKISEWLTWFTVVLWLITVTILFYFVINGKPILVKEGLHIISLIVTTIICYVAAAIAITKYEMLIGTCARGQMFSALVELYSYVPPIIGIIFYVHMLRRNDPEHMPRLISLAYLCLATIGLLTGHGFWVLIFIAVSRARAG